VVEKRNAYRVLVATPEGKRPLGRPRRRRKNNVTRSSGRNGTDCVENKLGEIQRQEGDLLSL
jgi:hypothetical protein